MKPKYEFKECDTCRAKPGTPTLCSGCYHNRYLISEMNKFFSTMEQLEKDKKDLDEKLFKIQSYGIGGIVISYMIYEFIKWIYE